jgi:hypothetical protein
MSSSSSSSSDTVYDCLSLEGEVIGEAPRCDGGVEGRSLVDVGDEGEAGRRKGEERGELRKEDCLYQPLESIEIVSHIPCCSARSHWSCGGAVDVTLVEMCVFSYAVR